MTANERKEKALAIVRKSIRLAEFHIKQVERAMRLGFGPFDIEEIRVALFHYRQWEKSILDLPDC